MSLAQGNSGSARPTGRYGAIRRWLSLLLVPAILFLVVVSVAALLSTWIPQLIIFQPFAAQVTAVALICAVLGLLLGVRRWALASAALAVWQAALLLPFLWPPAETPTAGPPLRVLSINLWRSNPAPDQTIAYLLGSGADIIGTVETNPEWRRRLTALETAYPYHVDCVATVFGCGVALFSKRPIDGFFVGRVPGNRPVVVWARLNWEGKPLIVAELQLIDPLVGLQRGIQGREAANVTEYFSTLDGDMVAMGDFNSAPWGTVQQAFRGGTRFDNRGRLAFTWPSWAPAPFRLPIDQIFTAGGLAVRNYRAGPAVGSDHLPVVADIYRTAP
jgi:endonuclease/exonuclease/phosphatase (EEP) superfamily protein YafD